MDRSYYWKTPNRVLSRLRAVPALSATYGGVAAIRDAEDLARVPCLDEDAYRAAVRDRSAQGWPGCGAHVFLSSGSTSDPKLSLMPTHLFAPEILAHWDPFPARAGLMIDFSVAGKAWSASHFYREMCRARGFALLHVGSVDDEDEMESTWADAMRRLRPCVIAGNPSQLDFVARFFTARGEALSSVRTVLWTAEPLRAHHREAVTRAFPEAALWSVYGSTETWVVGVQRPDMPADEYETLPYQHVEAGPDGVVVTTRHAALLNPILRYALPDVADTLEHDGIGGARRFRVRGRNDRRMPIDGNKVSPDVVLGAARTHPDVLAAQLVVSRAHGVIKALDLRVVRASGDGDLDGAELARRIMAADLQNKVLAGRLAVVEVARLEENRTGKTPDVVFRDIA